MISPPLFILERPSKIHSTKKFDYLIKIKEVMKRLGMVVIFRYFVEFDLKFEMVYSILWKIVRWKGFRFVELRRPRS